MVRLMIPLFFNHMLKSVLRNEFDILREKIKGSTDMVSGTKLDDNFPKPFFK